MPDLSNPIMNSIPYIHPTLVSIKLFKPVIKDALLSP